MASPVQEPEPTRQLNIRLPAGLVSWAEDHSRTVIKPRHKRAAHQGTVSAFVELLLQRERRKVERREGRAGQSEA
jgi:hypothetical protein